MFGCIKAFEKKLVVLSTDLRESKLKYFPQLLKHFTNTSIENEEQNNALKKYFFLMEEAKNVMFERFAQFQKLEVTLQFILSPHVIHFENLCLSKFEWLHFSNLQMEIINFQENAARKTKFVELNQHLQEIEIKTDLAGSDLPAVESRTENVILTEWNSVPNSFETTRRFAVALLTLFGSSYLC